LAANENLDIFVSNGFVSTCPCPVVGNWGITCNDNCSLTACDMQDNNVSITGTGITTGISNITNYTILTSNGGCITYE